MQRGGRGRGEVSGGTWRWLTRGRKDTQGGERVRICPSSSIHPSAPSTLPAHLDAFAQELLASLHAPLLHLHHYLSRSHHCCVVTPSQHPHHLAASSPSLSCPLCIQAPRCLRIIACYTPPSLTSSYPAYSFSSSSSPSPPACLRSSSAPPRCGPLCLHQRVHPQPEGLGTGGNGQLALHHAEYELNCIHLRRGGEGEEAGRAGGTDGQQWPYHNAR